MEKSDEEKESLIDKAKRRTSSFFDGDDGSFFWLCKMAIETFKLIVESINGWLAARRAERGMHEDE